MISKEELGSRIRAIRKERGLTLKELEKISGFSATHISEIERGKTSPTIGALVRIAQALGKETSFFLEEEQLSDVAVVRRDERQPIPVEEIQVRGEYLTPGIPGGRLNAYMVHLEPGGAEGVYPAHNGEEGLYVLSGIIDCRVGDRILRMKAGDAVHYPCDRPHGFRNAGETKAQAIFLSTRRLRKDKSSSGATGRIF